ncbi:bifunctional DNA primase/polymerase [Thalassoglobus sp.]|uniref:bifunctional DNA primase/polymerase n=1 Tax=Thalassoglobus sp. TaxID=2795869 RepID=UPI003AA9900A
MVQPGHDTPTPLEAAHEYVRRGWSVVPIPYKQKGAVIKGWEQFRLTDEDLADYFDQPANIGIILGDASRCLVDVDLDCAEAIEIASKYLPATDSKTGRLGAPHSHWWYYATDVVTGQHRDPQTNDMLVELRGNGAQTVVGPSIHPDDGSQYEVLRGEPACVPAPMLTACVDALAKRVIEMRYGSDGPQKKSETKNTKTATLSVVNDRPQIDSLQIERRALAYLDKIPSAVSGQGGHSTTYTAAVALVHGFEIDPEQALAMLLAHYNPRCAPPWSEKELRHKVEDAAKKSHSRPRGWLLEHQFESLVDPGVNIQTIVAEAQGNRDDQSKIILKNSEQGTSSDPVDPGPIPEKLLYIPGFVNDVMQFSLETAPYPNRPLAFVGAIALLGTLTGRKVREPGNIRTNVQILALASSGVGKDWPRKVNANILLHAGEARKLAGKSASGEGIEDRLIRHPVILKQDDEIDALFENMKDNKEVRYRNQFGMLLELYGEAGGWRSIRDKAGCESGLIHQPHLVLFGTTTPGEFYDSLSGKMLNKGLLARIISVEAGQRGNRRRANWTSPPENIIDTARSWSEFRPPGWGNLSEESSGEATPLIVPITQQALRQLDCFADECDSTYRAAAKLPNEPVMAIWARAIEKTTQLALIYACSQHGIKPVIEPEAIDWASAFIRHTIQRTIFVLGKRFHESDFEQKCKQVLETLTDWYQQHGCDWMPFRDISRKHRWPRREHDAVRETLVDQELIETDTLKTAGRPRLVYRLLTKEDN